MKFKTSTPRLFARFFLEVNFEEVKRKIELHESCHGDADDIDVIFFKHNGKKTATIITEDTNALQGIVHFNVSDSHTSKGVMQRQLLVEVII